MLAEKAQKAVFAKLDALRERFEQLGNEMNRPEVAGDAAQITALAKEHGQLRHVVEPYLQYRRIDEQVAESRELLATPDTDVELRELAQAEIADLQEKRGELFEHVLDLVMTGDDAAISSVILEIRAGTGGEEAALFARDLYEMYQRYAERVGFRFETMDTSTTALGGFKEALVNIKGDGVYQQLGYEGGGHRVQRVPKTEAQGRVHTSAATVAILPEPEEIDIQIDWEHDVIEHVSRAGGPGGQNVNKVSSAIRLEHPETGITVSMRDEKSQHKNRAKARRIMLSRLYDHHMQMHRNERDAARRTMIGSGDRSQRIRTYNFPQNRCTDHRINLDLYSLDRVMQGELDGLIAALKEHDRRQRLENL
ncbi:MAG: peptide chain release factor 1 [Phycisphaerae bacterium]|nr:peptide chain release factor 1 [Phycisphaerae bacterium]